MIEAFPPDALHIAKKARFGNLSRTDRCHPWTSGVAPGFRWRCT
jgi:hypothetical protein